MNSRRRRRVGDNRSTATSQQDVLTTLDAPDNRRWTLSLRKRQNGVFLLLFVATMLAVTRTQSTTIIQSNPSNTKLRRDWTSFTRLSSLAQGYKELQSTCGLGEFQNRFSVMGVGLGSELHTWTEQLCGAYSRNKRVRSLVFKDSWTWLDQEACNTTQAKEISPLYCYFPAAEGPCTVHKMEEDIPPTRSLGSCDKLKEHLNLTTADVRTSGIEFLFSNLSSIVVKEAQRQARIVFGGKPVPDNLITVHVRWGDKVTSREMKFVPIEDYINAVSTLAEQRNPNGGGVSVYLATEDPKAVQQFHEKAPPEWNIYVDQYYHEVKQYRQVDKELWNQNVFTSKEMKGRAGLLTLASLLVAMEANDYVLTTASNWSRLMNEVRTAILDVECGGCTRMIDLQEPSVLLQV